MKFSWCIGRTLFPVITMAECRAFDERGYVNFRNSTRR